MPILKRKPQVLISPEARQRPKMIKWKNVHIVRQQSFLATIQEIIDMIDDPAFGLDVARVGIIGDMSSGKSTMAEAIAHAIHKNARTNFAVRIFDSDDLLDFENTLKRLKPANYILVFDDVSFLEGSANKQSISKVKKAVTTIRHLEGGKDVKIVLIYNYHYQLGLDKYLRMADFEYFTTIGSSEIENMEKKVKSRNMPRVLEFIKHRNQATKSRSKDKFWTVNISPKESCAYKWRNPFIPALFWNQDSLREIISPTRQWLDSTCSICDLARNNDFDSEIDVKQFLKETYGKYNPDTFKAVVKSKLKEMGIANTYSNAYVHAQKYLDRALERKKINLNELAAELGLTPTKARLNKKLDGVLT